MRAEEVANFDMEQIIVTADAEKSAEQSESSIVSTKIVKPGKATNVSDLLTDLVGVDIVRRAIVGDNQDTVKLRGFDGSRFMVLIDGRPVNSAGVVGGCYVDWGTFPLDNVDKIEVIRGPKSAVYGNTLGELSISLRNRAAQNHIPVCKPCGAAKTWRDINLSTVANKVI